MAKIKHAALEPYIALAEQSGAELRSVVALAKADRLSALFDRRNGVLRRINTADPQVARRYLLSLRRSWERREGRPDPLRCPTCGEFFDVSKGCWCTETRDGDHLYPGYHP